VNVHASLLPRWRGAAPIQWAIASGDVASGVCLMQMEAGLDTGPVLAVRRMPILPDDTSESLHVRLSELGGALVRDELPRFLAGALTPRPQPTEGVTLARLVKKEDGRLDWTRPAVELERRVRAFVPWPGGWTQLGPQLLKVWRAQVVPGSGPPGTVLAAQGTLELACGEGALRLVEVQPGGKRRMTAAEFLSGHRLRQGERPFGEGAMNVLVLHGPTLQFLGQREGTRRASAWPRWTAGWPRRRGRWGTCSGRCRATTRARWWMRCGSSAPGPRGWCSTPAPWRPARTCSGRRCPPPGCRWWRCCSRRRRAAPRSSAGRS
jgi:hypothetical protein